jgi:hypothetical protein
MKNIMLKCRKEIHVCSYLKCLFKETVDLFGLDFLIAYIIVNSLLISLVVILW